MHPEPGNESGIAEGVEDRRRKLRLIARIAEWIALSGICLVIAYGGYLWWNPAILVDRLKADIPGIVIAPSDFSVALAFAVSLVPVAIFIAAMWQARRLFQLLGRSRIVDPEAPRVLVRLGGLAIAAAVAGIVVRTLVVLIMTSANPPGQRQLAIGIGSSEISSLVIGLLAFAFALVMQEALRIEDENRTFV